MYDLLVIIIGVLGTALTLALFGYFTYAFGKKKGYAIGHAKGAIDFLDMIIVAGFAEKVKSFRKLNARAQKGGIVFVGDSITQDYNVSEYFPGRLVYNRGIGGDTTVGLLKRLDESVFDLAPKTVVLLIGTNDLALLVTTPEEVASRIETIVKTIQAKMPETKIILQAVYPVNAHVDPGTVGKRKNEDIRTINSLMKQIHGVTFLDCTDAIADAEGNFDRRYTVEGLHMNQDGYALITQRIDPLL